MQCQVPTSFLRTEGEERDEQCLNLHNMAPAQGNPDTRMTRSHHSRSEHGSRSGNDTAGSGTVPMERAYEGIYPQDTPFEDPPDNIVYPEDSISCLNGSPNADNEESCAGDEGSSDIVDDSELWIQDIRAWQMNVRYALPGKEDLNGSSSSSGSSSGSCSEPGTMVDEDPPHDKESVIVDLVAVKSGEIIAGSPLICGLV